MIAKPACAAMIAVLLFGFTAINAQPVTTDPKVPSGPTTSGGAIALVCSGVDYTEAHRATRLARDGEGEIIGYDFIDDDRRPFLRDPQSDCNVVADLVLDAAPTATLIIVRADVSKSASLALGLGYAATSPARIILVLGDSTTAERDQVMDAAERRFPNAVFVEPGNRAKAVAASGAAKPRHLKVISIEAEAAQSLHSAKSGNANVGVAPLTAPLTAGTSVASSVDADHAALDVRAAAAIAAALMRLQASDPSLNADAMVARLRAEAAPIPGYAAVTGQTSTPVHYVRHPNRLFGAEKANPPPGP